MFDLNSKVAIVTGGAGLYGKSISQALAEAGAQVVIASRNRAKCEALARQLEDRGLKAESMSLDLADDGSMKDFVRQVHGKHGRVDILINNAVSREGSKDLSNLTKAGLESSQLINYTGVMLLTQAVVEIMLKQRQGNVINIGSIQGAVGPNFTVYGETGMTSPVTYSFEKWGMVGFTKWLANYYGRFNIRANCISPGGYGPGIREQKLPQEFVDNYLRLTPLKRFAEDNDIKGPVVFLASDASAYVTGHNLIVDGGWTSW